MDADGVRRRPVSGAEGGEDRYVIPQAHTEDAGLLLAQHEQLFCAEPGGGADFHPAPGPFRDGDGRLHLDVSPRSES